MLVELNENTKGKIFPSLQRQTWLRLYYNEREWHTLSKSPREPSNLATVMMEPYLSRAECQDTP